MIRTVEWDLQDLVSTISIVENNRDKFKFEDAEIERRKKFIDDTNRTISNIKRDLESPSATSQGTRGARFALMGSASTTSSGGKSGPYGKLDDEIVRDNDAYIQEHELAQRGIDREKDKIIDQISINVGVIHEQASVIGTTLDDHNRITEELIDETEATQGRVMSAVKRVETLIDNASNSTSLIIIGILILVLVGLILTVIYI